MAFGMMHYANGEVYEGEFQKGERHGVGTYSNKLGQLVHEGHWDNDRFIGSGANWNDIITTICYKFMWLLKDG